MKIDQITIRDFKALKELSFSPGYVNVFVGANGSGKSTLLEAIGVSPIIEVDPFDQERSVEAVKKASESNGVSAVIFKSPCISIASKLGYKFPGAKSVDAEKCIGCRKCINELGCPALSLSAKTNSRQKQIVEIDGTLCTGCGLCKSVCPVKAID